MGYQIFHGIELPEQRNKREIIPMESLTYLLARQ